MADEYAKWIARGEKHATTRTENKGVGLFEIVSGALNPQRYCRCGHVWNTHNQTLEGKVMCSKCGCKDMAPLQIKVMRVRVWRKCDIKQRDGDIMASVEGFEDFEEMWGALKVLYPDTNDQSQWWTHYFSTVGIEAEKFDSTDAGY